MIQIFADDELIYDSRLHGTEILGLPVTSGLNKGGTAEIILPPDHPAYGRFVSYKTIVTIYKGTELKFRGRALYPHDDFFRRRTITCEGERCFFRDGVMRPYLYQDSPAAIFTDVVEIYNLQVEEAKQFLVGTITVTDPNEYIRLEASEPEQVADTLDALVERCGGYITFTTNNDGRRVVNWLADLNYRSSQVIEFGKNLTDFSRSDGDAVPITRLIPYGAKDEATGERLTIESVNDGLDFIQDDEAVALRGVIAQPMTWDDVTLPGNLLAKAQQYLSKAKNVVTSLQLTAVDLSDMDKDIDTFEIGDLVRVRSKPHKVDDDFLLTDRSEDLLNPSTGRITLGKEVQTLTGSAVLSDRKNTAQIQRVEQIVRADYSAGTAALVEEAKLTLTSLIEQTTEAITMEVAEQYATNDAVQSAIGTSMQQLADSFTFLFEQLQVTVDENDAAAREQYNTITSWIKFQDGDIVLGQDGDSLILRQQNDRISFIDDGAEVAYFSNKKLVVLDGHFLNSLRVGPFEAIPRVNGNLSIVKAGV
jgi:hypothetical protein